MTVSVAARLRPNDGHCAAHWSSFAERWDDIVPPLRPCAEDLAVPCREIGERFCDGAPPNALVLGATQEFARLPWPAGTTLTAVDRSQAMLDALWPLPRRTTICADWSDLPFPDESVNMALCDGGLNMLPYPYGQRAVLRDLWRVLRPGGIAIIRLYVPPILRVAVEDVIADAVRGFVASLSVFKMRLWAAMQVCPERGVVLDDVWQVFEQAFPDRQALSEWTGWPLDQISTIDLCRREAVRHYLFGIAEAERLFTESPGGFDLTEIRVPSYAYGEGCPTVTLTRR